MYKRWKQHDVKGRGLECWRTKHITDKYWTMYLLCGFYWTAVEIEERGEGEREREEGGHRLELNQGCCGKDPAPAHGAHALPGELPGHLGHYIFNYEGNCSFNKVIFFQAESCFSDPNVLAPLMYVVGAIQEEVWPSSGQEPPTGLWDGLKQRRQG